MGQLYSAVFDNVSVALAQDFFEITAPADAIVVVHSWFLSQYGVGDVGDAAEELLDIETVAGPGATGGSGGTLAITANPLQTGFAAHGSTVDINNTARMTVVTNITWKGGMNVRVPFEMVYTPETRPIISAGDLWTLSLNAAPADAVTMNGSLVFEEIGG